jgi:hypothetical protein
MTVPTTPSRPMYRPDQKPCTCLPSDSDSVGYLEYAVGRTEAENALAEERARCLRHGEGTPPS